jgi:hypothetical protein
MFNDIIADSQNIVLVARLQRAISKLTTANYSTLEEYQTAIYSAVNSVLSLRNSMQTLASIKGGTPALISNLSTNISNLSNDIIDTVSYLTGVETNAANLFNLGELSQSQIRQTIRSQIYTNNSKYYVENFISNENIQSTTTTIDNQAGSAFLPLSSETQQSVSASLGTSSVGSSSDSLSNLLDGAINTSFVWVGATLELILTFPVATIVNRLVIDLDTYDGLIISNLTASPDGTTYNDILSSLNVNSILMNATNGKYSGAVVIDFPPQYVLTIKLVINNVIGTSLIALRNLYLYSRQYASSGQLTSTLISNPVGEIAFGVQELLPTSTNIVHQYSYDNVHFNTLVPGVVNFTQAYWYRALLSRTTTSTATNGLSSSLPNSSNYQVSNYSLLNLGSNITQVTISFSVVSGPIVLGDIPLPKSLVIQVSSVVLNTSQYTFLDNTVTLSSTQSNVTIVYQTVGLNSQILSSLQNYSTPILTEYTFES